MDINQLRYYIEVCNCGSISKAAEKVHLSQQGLSLSIRRLEQELEADLFYRKPGGIVLTELGKAVKEEAEELLKHVDNIYSLSNKLSSGRPRIRIAISESIIVRLPAKLQQILLTGCEDFDVDLIELFSYGVADAVSTGRADFGILYGDCDEDKFDATVLDVVRQVIIVNTAHPLARQKTVTLRELAGLPFIAPSEESYPRRFLNRLFKEENIPLQVAYICNRPRQVIDIISNNPLLVSRTIADEITDKDLSKISVLELSDKPFSLPIRLINKQSRQFSVYEKLFMFQALNAYDPDK